MDDEKSIRQGGIWSVPIAKFQNRQNCPAVQQLAQRNVDFDSSQKGDFKEIPLFAAIARKNRILYCETEPGEGTMPSGEMESSFHPAPIGHPNKSDIFTHPEPNATTSLC